MDYAHINAEDVGAWDWWGNGRSINLTPVVWVPQAEMSNPVANYALKFEFFTEETWDNGIFLIMPQCGKQETKRGKNEI